ncbi:hypothetical protein Emed_003063 [Eimeria media]
MDGCQTAARKDKSLDEEDLWDSRLKLIWRTNGVKYELLAHFKTLTPAYNAEGTAAELEKGIPELLEEARLYEEHAREGEHVRLLVRDFGNSESGKGTMSIQSEFFRSIRLAIAPPVA